MVVEFDFSRQRHKRRQTGVAQLFAHARATLQRGHVIVVELKRSGGGHQQCLVGSDEKREVREDLGGSIEDGQQVLPAHVVELHPLLEYAVRSQALAAQLVEFAVVQVRFPADPDGGDLNRDQVVAILGEQQEISAVGYVHADARVAIQNFSVDVLEP